MVKLIIPGEPVAKARPRVTRYGTYTPEKTVNYETLIRELYIVGNHPKLEGPLRMDIVAYFKIPKSASKVKRQGMIDGLIRPTKRPDIDNIYKAFADGLEGVAYDNDSQIVTGMIQKWYAEDPRVEVMIEKGVRL